MVEHEELLWSLFAVDMETVLQTQPPDTWDSFPLFQVSSTISRTLSKINITNE
jgi:hypothetical protein